MATKNINTAGDSGTKSKSTESKPKSTETKSKSAQTKPAESKSAETKSKPAESKSKPTETKPKSTETKQKTAEKKPAETKPAEPKSKPVEPKSKPVEPKSKTVETKTKQETKSKSAQTKPVESKSAESKSKPTESKSKSTEPKTVETKTKSAEPKSKTAEPKSKSTEQKTAEQKTKAKPAEESPKTQEETSEEKPAEIKINFNAAEAIEKAEKAMSAIEEYVPESAKPKFSKVKKIVIAAVSGFVVLLSAAWFFCGKPIVEIGAEGFTVYPTEDPILYHIPEYLSGEYPPETNYGEINGTGGVFNTSIVLSQGKITLSGDIIRDKSTQPASDGAYSEKPSSKSGSGTKGSNPKADSGHAENSPLYFGNPTDSMPDSEMNANYLMVKDQYTVSYNTRTLCPNWVAWHLDKSNMGPADRCDDFRPDEDLPEAWYGVKKADYQYNKYGFDRGHVCPSADRTATKLDNSMTFLMTNMVPQSPDNNRVIWMHFENYERELVNKGNEVYIIAGPYGTGGTSQKGTFDEIPITLKSKEVLHMNVPAYTWKVLIAIPDGEDDVSRIGEEAIVIAINVPNRMGMGKTGDWEQYICSVDEIEDLTGYDFFELLPDDIEDVLESREYVYTK